MVCGRLTRRTAWVMFGRGMVSRETLFTFPNPLPHLLGNLVSIKLTLER